MNKTLDFLNQQVNRFKNGEIDLATLWNEVESRIEKVKKDDEDHTDPFEDDKIKPSIPRLGITYHPVLAHRMW